MTKQILKTALAGILAGLAIFMIPFIIIKVLFFFLIIKAIFRLMGGRRHHAHWRYAYAQKFQNMSEEERSAFMQKYGNRCGWSSQCEPSRSETKEADKRSEN